MSHAVALVLSVAVLFAFSALPAFAAPVAVLPAPAMLLAIVVARPGDRTRPYAVLILVLQDFIQGRLGVVRAR
jgi:hypothetical protein